MQHDRSVTILNFWILEFRLFKQKKAWHKANMGHKTYFLKIYDPLFIDTLLN